MPYASPVSGTSGSLRRSSSPQSPSPLNKTAPTAKQPSTNRTVPLSLLTDMTTGVDKHHPGLFELYNDEDEAPEEELPEQSTHSSDNNTSPQATTKVNNTRLPPLRQQVLKRSSSQLPAGSAGAVSKLSLNLSEILKFPKESTHAYSYAHLSPNSLAVRLSILKRSLEILIDRPDLMDEKEGAYGFTNSGGVNLDIENFISEVSTEGDSVENEKKINISSNASSAALSALFSSNGSAQSPSTSTFDKPPSLDKSDGLKTLIKILQEDEFKDDPTTTKKTLAKTLHDLSLGAYRDEEHENSHSESDLRIKLLYALATPFYESILQTPIISLNKGASSLALSSLQNMPSPSSLSPTAASNKFFHSSQRNTSPQAVFTCELSNPWNLKAANDLSCLIFGVSRTSLRRLTLLDLISPDSRDFVFNRLIENSFTQNEIIFSGEIIAIAKAGNKLTWASLWAKKKGNLIICMFDQVPCDSVDLVVNFDTFNIESSKKISGASFFNDISSIKSMSDLINTFDEFMETHREQNEENNNIPRTILDSKALNEQRYFTIKKSGFNIPCAVTSKVIDEEEARVKLKIHTMPYIAGVFILSAKDHKLVAFNESISKNLFGFNEQQLLNQPIVKIIPNFEKIMQFIAKNLKNLKFLPGLVLPEHFFRQMDCLIQNQKDDSFLNSIGLDGIHADGSLINVDIQLRCTQSDTLVLWITHSRTVFDSKFEKKNRVTFKEKNEEELKYEELEKAQRNSKQTAFGEEGEYDQDGALPSQLSLLKEHDINFRSATSSVRSDLHTASSSTSSTTTSASTVSKQSSTSDIRELTSVSGSKASSSEISNDVNLETYKMLDSNMSEEALLKIENDTIQRQKSTSKYYPKTIGLKRREKSFKEFIVLKKMGQGAYGNVVLAENKNDPNYRIVIKLVIKERILVDTWVRDRKLGTIPSEIQIMSLLNNNPHPNIMRLIDFFEDDDYYYIETPQHGFPTPAIDLFDMIELKGSMSEDECKSIIKQAVSAIKHLHKNGVVHRDIKDENLIIDSNGVIKLIDFGSAACIKHGPFDVFVGTLDYAAPEVLNGQPYDGKPQDVWSLGILIYTLIYKENPFYNVDEIMEGELRIPFVMSEGSLNLIKKILQRDIQKRPKMEEIISDSWLST